MEELLSMQHREFEVASYFESEELGRTVTVDEEVSKPMFERFLALRSMMQGVQADIKHRCILFGWALKEMQEQKIYNYVRPSEKLMGYKSFYVFCKEVFGVKERTAQRMVAVAKEFCGESQGSGPDSGTVDIGVKIEYVNYSYSQLGELLAVEEKYRKRIPITCSCRNIRHLGELYRNYVPKSYETYEEDLDEWKKRKKAEKEKANAKKNAINFVPAKKPPTSAGFENDSDQDENDGIYEFDGEDERNISTPPTLKKPSYEAVREGLLCQLRLLQDCFENGGEAAKQKWAEFSRLIEVALKNRFPDYIVCYSDVVKAEMRANGDRVTGKAASGPKLNLKNEKERKEWLTNFRSWGVWIDVPEVGYKYYRYDFQNGCSIVVEESTYYFSDWRTNEIKSNHGYKYSIIDDKYPKFNSSFAGGISSITDWMTKHSKEI